MKQLSDKEDTWVVEPVGAGSPDVCQYKLSELILADDLGNRWVVDIDKACRSYPQLAELLGVQFNQKGGAI